MGANQGSMDMCVIATQRKRRKRAMRILCSWDGIQTFYSYTMAF